MRLSLNQGTINGTGKADEASISLSPQRQHGMRLDQGMPLFKRWSRAVPEVKSGEMSRA